MLPTERTAQGIDILAIEIADRPPMFAFGALKVKECFYAEGDHT